ncbi:MAG TPA: putative sugar nucleotidyl transferase [Tepidisphaeraceae bacterium]|nr:putative sugar nucleotidyl transferase [Tepidisphaeraceae bacterium]
MHVVVFEGSVWPRFAPLALSRPVFDLLSGQSTLLAKQVRHLKPTRLTLWVRPELEERCREVIAPTTGVPTDVNVPLGEERALLVSGRTVFLVPYEHTDHETVVHDENEIVQSAYVRSPGLGPGDVFGRSEKWLRLMDLPHSMPQGRMIDSLWDLIHFNEESLIEDFGRMPIDPGHKPPGPYYLVEDQDIRLAPGSKLEPGCVLDASSGPVVVGEHATIGANAVLKGPCYVGPHATVMPGALIRAGTSIGPMCRVGGEVSNSILLGYTNKSHEGFLGHSYLGKWVNLGSGTTTSNLKNTYGTITVRIGQKQIDAGRIFLGAMVGDHSKTAVLTRFSAGTYVGACSMLAGAGPQPQFIPSFTFQTPAGSEPMKLEKAMEVIARVYARRDRKLSPTDEQIVRYVQRIAPQVEA